MYVCMYKEQKNGENSVKRERELHFATVINKRLQRLHNQKEDDKNNQHTEKSKRRIQQRRWLQKPQREL